MKNTNKGRSNTYLLFTISGFSLSVFGLLSFQVLYSPPSHAKPDCTHCESATIPIGTCVEQCIADYNVKSGTESEFDRSNREYEEMMRLILDSNSQENGASKEPETQLEKWYRLASKENDPEAQYMYAFIHEYGMLGADVDSDISIKWYGEAAKQDYVLALNRVADYYYWSKDSSAKNIDEGIKLYRKAYEKGSDYAAVSLGYIYKSGRDHIKADPHESTKWFTLAALAGRSDAQYMLAMQYYEGIGIEKDTEKMFLWMNKSALQNYPYAILNLSLMYKSGIGVDKDLQYAERLYERAHLLGVEHQSLQ